MRTLRSFFAVADGSALLRINFREGPPVFFMINVPFGYDEGHAVFFGSYYRAGK